MTIITFDTTTAIESANDVPRNYSGLVWTNFSSVGRLFVHANLAGTGFESALRGDAVGYAPEHPGIQFDSRIGAPEHKTFNFKGGIMASVNNDDQQVTFHAYRHGHEIKSKTFTIDQDNETTFHLKGFTHLKEVRITTSGGTDTNPGDDRSGHSIAFDNLNIVINSQAAHPAQDHAHDFALDLALSYVSDWPLV